MWYHESCMKHTTSHILFISWRIETIPEDTLLFQIQLHSRWTKFIQIFFYLFNRCISLVGLFWIFSSYYFYLFYISAAAKLDWCNSFLQVFSYILQVIFFFKLNYEGSSFVLYLVALGALKWKWNAYYYCNYFSYYII